MDRIQMKKYLSLIIITLVILIANGTNASYNLDVSGTIYASGKIYANSFYENSDRTLKENIQELSKDLLEQVYNVKEVSFNWKKTGESAFGYIAQDFESISTTFIVRTDDDKLQLNYTEVLVAQIAALKQKIANLEERLHILERS